MAATVRASHTGLELVDKARCQKGWAKTEKIWAELANTSKATLRRFWAGLKIQTLTFRYICHAVGIEDWQSIADVDFKDDSLTKDYPKRLGFAIVGSIEDIHKQRLDSIVALLRKLGGDTEIEILDIEEGSMRLTLGGSEESLQRLQNLFASGELQEVEGLVVKDVHFLTKEDIAESIKNKASFCANLNRAYLHEVNLSRADLAGAYLIEADLSKGNLHKADLVGAHLIGAGLSEANLGEAYISLANLSQANLTEAFLVGAYLIRANLVRANLVRANLSQAHLNQANLTEANLTEADLTEADLTEVNLCQADLRQANLRRADLTAADLRQADLRGAYLHEAKLSEALVNMAQFTDTESISVEDKTLLIRRGAIFEDDPSPPDRARVLA